MAYLHVTSARNRESIRDHGLDWARMGAARGIAGSTCPELDGVFLCRDRWEADWFLGFDNGDGPFDVWSAEGVDEAELVDNGAGYFYVARRIPASQLTLVEQDLPSSRATAHSDPDSGAYRSTLTITFDEPN